MFDDVARRFAAARSDWLRAAERDLRGDERFAAALLVGSLGRGDGDQWSDVDLIAVVAQDYAAEVVVGRDSFVRGFGDALFVFDSPWNAPQDGAQVNALYDLGCGWPLYVDWDVWPHSWAAIPDDVGLLFDRVQLPVIERSLDEYRRWPTGPRPDPTEEVMHEARIAMIPIIAKCIIRHDTDRAERMLGNLGYPDSDGSSPIERVRAMWSAARVTTSSRLSRALDTTLDIAEGQASDPSE